MRFLEWNQNSRWMELKTVEEDGQKEQPYHDNIVMEKVHLLKTQRIYREETS